MTTMQPRFKTGILAGLTLLAVTACGGGSSTLPMEINLDTPVPAAALEPVAALEPAAALEPIAASNQDVLDNAGNVGCEAAPEVFRQTMLELANAARVEARMCGLSSHDATGTLEWNNQLALAAAAHGRDMATNNFFAFQTAIWSGSLARPTVRPCPTIPRSWIWTPPTVSSKCIRWVNACLLYTSPSPRD